ncbi:MAG TPA: Trk system potassium transporter TrkA [Archaeoglobus veneficus]|nr:Trk system potassium transporter TrkA [Archaeoglobus veneficus]
MRIVIAGAGEVGLNLAKALSEKNEVYVIDKDEEKIEYIKDLNVEAIKGNAANLEILNKANIKKADIFIGVTGNDEVNLLSGLAAKKFGVNKTIVRVRNPEYVNKPFVVNHPMGFDLIVCPQLALANEVSNLITIPGAIEVISFSGGKVEMVEFVVEENSSIAGKKIAELNLPPNVIITAICREDELILPRGDTEILVGDKVAIVGKPEDLLKIRGYFGKPVVKNVVIFGGGTIGSYVARILDKSNLNIKLIDSNPEVCENLCSILKRTRVIIGDATDLDFLIEEEIGKSDVVVSTTESDEKNLLICLLAKSLGAKKAIAKVEKGVYVKLFEKVGIDVALNPRKVTFYEVMKHLRLMQTHTLVDVSGMTILEISVEKEDLSGKKIAEISLPKKSIIGGVLRGEECLIPKGDTTLKMGDKLLIFTTWDEIDRIEKVFK